MSLSLLIFVLQFPQWAEADALDDAVNYVTEVRPILSDRCFTCHGPDAAVRATDLRLDDEASVHHLAVVPGDADSSELIRRIESSDPEVVMPPPGSNLNLTATEREILRRWVNAGAKFAKHWAFVPLKGGPSSESDRSNAKGVYAWSESDSPLDRIAGKRLETLQLNPSPEADRTTLIRRLFLDLNGLLPEIDEVDNFLSSTDPAAYELLVDRLLSRQQFGEKWAVDWLDVARYADTFGYQADVYRAMWPWRDWVIQSLNSNLPYDQFIIWQLAGDLLPNPTQDQILATAFNRNHRQTNEGGSVEEEFRAEYVADRVNTFGAAFLGLTLECARCHDHKYDPISQSEYYQLAAFFNSIDESGLYSHFTSAVPTPTFALATDAQNQELEQLAAALASKELQLLRVKSGAANRPSKRDATTENDEISSTATELDGEISSPILPLQADTIRERLALHSLAHYRFEDIEDGKLANEKSGQRTGKVSEAPSVVQGVSGNGLLLSGENNATVPEGGNWTRNQPFSISFWVNVPQYFERCVLLHRSRAWTDAASRGYEILIEGGRASVGLIHFWPGNAIRILSKDPLPLEQWTHLGITYDGSSRADGLQLFINGHKAAIEVVRDCLTNAIHGGEATELAIGQRFRDVGFKNGKVDELQLFQAELTALEMQYLYWQVAASDSLDQRVAEGSAEMAAEFFRYGLPERLSLESELQEIRNRLGQLRESIPEIMVMNELATPRPTYILHRGEYSSPGDQVERGVLTQIFPMPDDRAMDRLDLSHPQESKLEASDPKLHSGELSRLDLARWLTDPEHPLTARVAVNRVWQSLFGIGLVGTSEDFGFQGAVPMHPELLDWLAEYFVQSGWDVKGLIKTIVMSQVYRQQSDIVDAKLLNDPENRWLARGPAVRLSAELVRDSALCASGLLVDSLGGPPVKPYQPDGLWEEKSNASYQRDVGQGSRRRSIYTFWKRTSPPPMMMTFDASNREVCVVRRQTTMTPLQNLVLLNDPQFVEAARGLAEVACLRSSEDGHRLEYVFRRLIARQPSGREHEILLRMYNEQLLYFSGDAQATEQFLMIGDHRAEQSLDKAKLAALAVVAQGLMSYDEFVMKR